MLEIPFFKSNMANDIVGTCWKNRVFLRCKVILYNTCSVERDSAVGKATAYGLKGSRIVSRWNEIFRTRPHHPWGPPSILYNGYRFSHTRKAAWEWR